MLRDILKPSMVLVLVCIVVTAALAFTYSATRDTIAERVRIEAEEARGKVHGEAVRFEKLEGFDGLKEGRPEIDPVVDVFAGYGGDSGDTATGHVFSVVVKGYGGDLQMTVGIDNDGNITGVSIGENSETPGLGSKVTQEPFLSQFEGISPQGPLEVVKAEGAGPEEIDAVAGATISSRAVVFGVQAAVNASYLLREQGVGQR